MKRILTPALAVALAMTLGAFAHRAVAQEASGDAAAEADAGVSADQADQSSSSDASEASSADTQTDTSSSADASGSASTSDDRASSAATSDTQTSTSQDGATSDSQSSNDTSTSTDTSATDTDASVQTDAEANVNRRGDRQADSARGDASANVDADARGRANVDADGNVDAQGRASADRQRQNIDARGRANVDARDRADSNRDRRGFRGDRGRQRDRDVTVGIQFGRASDRGLVINTIERDSFFFDSGLRRGDIIVSIGGRPIHSHDDFRRWVVYRPGERVPVVILRDGRRETVYVTYHDDIQYQEDSYVRADRGASGYLGVTFDANVPNAAVLANVHPGSPAHEAGLQSGDDILALNEQEVRSFQDALQMIRTMRAGDELVIDFARQAEQGARPMEDRTTAVLAARPAQNVRREVRVYRGGPEYDRQYQYEDRRYENRREYRRDIDDDGRILDRNRDDRGEDNRGLLERVLD